VQRKFVFKGFLKNKINNFCGFKYQKAYLVLKECNRMNPEHVTCILLLSQLAIEQLLLVSWAEKKKINFFFYIRVPPFDFFFYKFFLQIFFFFKD
jgi:hypothetical protein